MASVAQQVCRRTRVRSWVKNAIGDKPIKPLAKAAGLDRRRLHGVLNGTQRLDVVTLLGFPESVRDEVLSRVAEECDRELVPRVSAWSGGWNEMRRDLWSCFAEFYDELQDIGSHVTATKATTLRPLARRLREIATAVEILCEKAERERVVSVEEVSK